MPNYQKSSFKLTEAEILFIPTVDDLLYLAEIEAIYLNIYPADYFVRWAGTKEHERIKRKYILVPRYAEALRTNRNKEAKYVYKVSGNKFIRGTLYRKDKNNSFRKKTYLVGVDQITVCNDEILKIESGDIEIWKNIKNLPLESGNKKYPILKKGINKTTACLIASDVLILLGKYDKEIADKLTKTHNTSDSTIGYLIIIKLCCLCLASLAPDEFAYGKEKVLVGYRQKFDKSKNESVPVGIVGHIKKYISKDESISNLQKYISQALNLDIEI